MGKSPFREEEAHEVVIEYDGDEYKLKVRDLTWSEMNQLLAKCAAMTQTGGSFNLDMYYREALIKMVEDSPWGPFKHETIVRFTADFGAALEKLVPFPGGGQGLPFLSGSQESATEPETSATPQ